MLRVLLITMIFFLAGYSYINISAGSGPPLIECAVSMRYPTPAEFAHNSGEFSHPSFNKIIMADDFSDHEHNWDSDHEDDSDPDYIGPPNNGVHPW